MQNPVYDQIKTLSPATPSSTINAVLETIAVSLPGPIELDLFLKAMAAQLGLSLKPVRQSYEMILKKLSIQPVDIGLTIAQELLDTRYGSGTALKLTQDGFLYAYAFTHWAQISEAKIRSEIQEIAVKYKTSLNKSLHSLVNDAFGSLKDYLGSNNDVLSLTDEPLPVINCKNGELWIDANGVVELRPHKPETQLFYCLPYEYAPQATCPVFDKVLLEIFAEAQEPKELCRHAWELLGYAIQPRRPIPCFWLLIGHGANGKTKFLQTMSRLISTDYLHNVDLSSFGRDKFNISQLQGKLVMIDDDIKMNTLIPDGLLKKVSEAKLLTARSPYGKKSITFLNAAMPIMVGNHYPLCEDLSDGLLRRAMVIQFRRQFKPHEQDNAKFEYVWANEMPGVLNRAIEGFQRVVQRKHFEPPKECIDARHEFLSHGNPLYCFLSECLEVDAESRTPLPHLREAYEMWAKRQNQSTLKVLNKTLKRRLQALGYTVGLYNGYSSVAGYKIKMTEATN